MAGPVGSMAASHWRWLDTLCAGSSAIHQLLLLLLVSVVVELTSTGPDQQDKCISSSILYRRKKERQNQQVVAVNQSITELAMQYSFATSANISGRADSELTRGPPPPPHLLDKLWA
jgi:hypothetical protein